MIMQRRIYQGLPVIIDDPRIDPARMAKAWAKDGLRSIRANMLSMAAANQPGEKSWFVVQTVTGRERAVEKLLNEAGVDALLPMRKGKRVLRRGRVRNTPDMPAMPGYVLVSCVYSAAAMAGLRGIEHVLWVVGKPEQPYRVRAEEVLSFKSKAQAGEYDHRDITITYSKGEQVLVADGPFASFPGVVADVDEKQPYRVKVEVSIFGRMTPVELDIAQIEKV
ncbi:transcription termination/antitermination protein NusG [Sinorhizobium meliloti]|uniref:transcription termination/antitermination protein NusG n=1 Tax=Rhizobium meliloti TaxID=382 RepID=UPI000FDBF68A|nr:transcription termination/antitermination NusG family protein [Sinorhizobium meliloti]RVM91477.1 NusG antitermination factor [Sinorhizobium meliloti]